MTIPINQPVYRKVLGFFFVAQMPIWVFPKIGVPPNLPFLMGFSIINQPFLGTPIFGNTHIRPSWTNDSTEAPTKTIRPPRLRKKQQ